MMPSERSTQDSDIWIVFSKVTKTLTCILFPGDGKDSNIQNVSSKVSSDSKELMAKTLTFSKVSSDGDNSNMQHYKTS